MAYELKLFTGNAKTSKRGFAPLRAVPQRWIALAEPALEKADAGFERVRPLHCALLNRFERGLGPRHPRGRFGRGT